MSDDDNTIELADGTVIDMRTGRPKSLPGYVEVPTHTEAQIEVTRVRKRLADLPDIGPQMNATAAVAAYHMFGLDDAEIAHAMGCTERQVSNIKMTEAFTSLMDTLNANIVESQQDTVRGLLQQHSTTAAQAIIRQINSRDPAVAIAASKDVLDRAGHRPADIVEHRHKVEGGLTIEYVKRSSGDDMPVLDLRVEGDD